MMKSLVTLFDSAPDVALIVAVLVALSLLGNAVLLMSSRRLLLRLQVQSARLTDFDQRLNMLASGSLSIGDRVVNLEAKLANVELKQDSLANNDKDFSYTQAMTMLHQGIEPEIVAANCGLSHSEVGLMSLLYQSQQQNPQQGFAVVG